jgi:RNA polymerase sigma-70 factor (ECF subfamily)
MSAEADAVRSRLLLLRHRGGERAALAELLGMWERPLLYYLRRLLDTEEDAWDALQTTWLLAVRALPRLRDDRAFPAWLYAISRRVAFRARERARPHEPLPEDDAADAIPAESGEPSLAGFGPNDIHRALAGLSLAHRDVLSLHFLQGFSIAEIGAITGAAEGTVKSRLFHARRALRIRLKGDSR